MMKGVFMFMAILFASIFQVLSFFQNQSEDRNEDLLSLNEFQSSIHPRMIYIKNDSLSLPDISAAGETLKIVSWNIERGFHPDVLYHYLNGETADIICLQEVDWGNTRTCHQDILDTLAKRLNMKGFFSTEFYELDSPLRKPKMASGGVHGNAILTRFEPSRVFRVELPQYYDWENHPASSPKRVKQEKRLGARFALCATYRLNNDSLVICSTHFEDKDGGVAGRVAQLDTLLKQVSGKANSIVIAGDMNTFDSRIARWAGFSKSFQAHGKPNNMTECEWWNRRVLPTRDIHDPFGCESWTFKVFAFKQKLDWILFRNIESFHHGMGNFNTSDHRPLWVEFAISGHSHK